MELAWIDGVEDVMVFEEQMLAHAIGKVADAHGEAIAEHFGVEATVPSTPFPRITMDEAHEILRTSGWGPRGRQGGPGPGG